MYEKNLTEDFRLRLSSVDMDFLKKIANERSVTVSECVRGIIGEYRRSIETLQSLQKLVNLASQDSNLLIGAVPVVPVSPAASTASAAPAAQDSSKGVGLSNGDTKTNIDDKL